jgi:RNA polymerase-binding transcription factor DksA
MNKSRARKLLHAERRRLEEVRDTFPLSDLSQAQQESVDELSSVDQHVADLGTETFEREKEQSIRISTETQLADVDRALGKLDDGRYGFCETCGNAIPDQRLEARPAARYCLEDQEKVEQGVVAEP